MGVGWIQWLSCVGLVLGLVHCQMIANFDIIRDTSQRDDGSIKSKESRDVITIETPSQDKAISKFGAGRSHDSRNQFINNVIHDLSGRLNEDNVVGSAMKYIDDSILNNQKDVIPDKSTGDCNARLESLETTVALLIDEIKTLKSKTGTGHGLVVAPLFVALP